MSNNQKRGRIGGVFAMLGDAISVAAAVRARRQPDAQSLRRLGIDPEQFAQIGRY